MQTLATDYVQSPQALAPALESIRESPHVALDTEFISEGSYEPLLCLLQLATRDGIWIVDPLARLDLGPLWEALTEPGRELVALAARQEIRFCMKEAGRLPGRLLDVQLAAGLVGYSYPLSHTNLVREVLGVRVNGGETFTDWSQRPLTERQLDYAADDVRYLLDVRDRLMERAAEWNRTDWIDGECRRLLARVTEEDGDDAWRRVSGSGRLGRRDLALVRELWRWRDDEARQANVPPRRILRDELLIEVIKRRPATLDDLFALRGFDRGMLRKSGPRLLEAVRTGLSLPESEYPPVFRRDDPPQVGVLAQLLSVASNGLAAEHHIDPALLATSSDLQDVVRWRLRGGSEADRPAALQGWRAEILQETLVEFLEGKRYVRVGNLRTPNPLVFEKTGSGD